MRVLQHPLRIGSDGRFSTVEQWSSLHAQQIAVHIVSTVQGERDLAPMFGVSGLVSGDVSVGDVKAAIVLCDPDIIPVEVSVSDVSDGVQKIDITVDWSDEDEVDA